MKGRMMLIAVGATLGISASHFSYHWSLLLLIGVYTVYVLFVRRLNLAFVALLAILFFGFHYNWQESNNQTSIAANTPAFKGTITSITEIDGDSLRFALLTTVDETIMIRYRIKSEQEQEALKKQLKIGMACNIKGELMIPPTATNEFAFDYRDYLRRQKIHWMFTASQSPLDSCIEKRLTVYEKLQRWRSYGIEQIEATIKQPATGFVAALVFGSRDTLDEAIISSYQTLGLSHLLAISGLHVGLITSFFFYTMVRVGLSREKAMLLLIVMLPLYILIAGASPSIIRAGFMTIAVLLSLLSKTKLHPLDGLSLVYLLMLFIKPAYLFEPGFQLSFIVTLSLIISSSIWLNHRPFFYQMIISSTIAQISSLPFVIYHFFEVSMLSIPFNLLFIPLITFLIMPLTFIIFVSMMWFPFAVNGFVALLNGILQIANPLLETIYQVQPMVIRFGRPPLWLLFGLSVCIYLSFYLYEKGLRLRSSLLMLAVLSLLLLHPYVDPTGEIAMLDVGQGDSIYIELPYREGVYLIDTGGTLTFGTAAWKERKDPYEVGEDTLIPFLKAKGVKQIDMLFLTHGDFDHIGAVPSLLKQVKVTKVVTNDKVVESEAEKTALSLGQQKAQIVLANEIVGFGNRSAHFSILDAGMGEKGSSNNKSIVIAGKAGGLRWLFTGDLEIEGEANLLQRYPNLEIDVLKAGHHGSKTSTSPEFLDRIQPRIALISAGRNNRYGHPHPSVLKELTERSIQVYRTDKHGAIHYKFSGNTGTFSFPAHKIK